MTQNSEKVKPQWHFFLKADGYTKCLTLFVEAATAAVGTGTLPVGAERRPR